MAQNNPVQTGFESTMQLLEREQFLAALATDLEAAASGAGRTVLVSGEAGIGKTSLLEHFVQAHPTGHMLWGNCEALFTPHPLGPIHDFARAAHGKLKALLDYGTDRATLFSAVLDELMLPPAPALLILEDIHWADDATLDLITFLGRRIHRAPALMVLTYRDDELDSGHLLRSILGHLPSQHVSRLPLQRLSPEAVATLAAGMKRDDAGVYNATGGNPFFVTEVLAHPKGGVPATVSDAVLGRASHLKPAAREALELASIVPRAIEASVIEAILGPDTAAVEECVTSGLLLAEDRMLRFRHELARVAVEASIPRPRAKGLHAKILAALTDQTSQPAALARLVHHAHLAEDRDAVLRLAPRAAREAAARGARREAAAHCKVALSFAHGLPDAERAVLLADYANHCFELNDLEAAIPAREAAIELFAKVGDDMRLSESLAGHAMSLVRALRNTEADAASCRAIEHARKMPEGIQLARAYGTEAHLRMLNRDYAEAIAWGQKAIALAERFDDKEILAGALNSVGAALMFVDYERGCREVGKGLAISGDLSDCGVAAGTAYMVLGTASGELYRFDNANRYLAEGIAFTRSKDLDRLGGYMEAWQSLLDVYQGNWEAAGERATALLAREIAGSTNRLMALVALGRLRIRRGDPGADVMLDEALELAQQSGSLQRVAPTFCTRAEAAWLRGDLPGMRREALAAYELAQAKHHPWFIGELAYWLWRAGDVKKAPAHCAQPYALQIGGKWQAAASAWETIGCPYEQARALADGDETAQRQALAIFDRMGATPMAERLRLSMRAAGVNAVPRGPRASTRVNAAGLTVREVEILELVALGWQNAQIAARLSRSPRTVEHHLAAILTKLEVGTRGEAVTVARDRGILAKMGTEPA
jgi:DNA-binding CsgD family transcriptional regulator/tetratricopeptide (TPR) repeat protein